MIRRIFVPSFLVISLLASALWAQQSSSNQNPLFTVAPETCWAYTNWTPQTPDPNSGNSAEKLLAEPEIQRFAESIKSSLFKIGTAALEHAPAEKRGIAQSIMPQLIAALFEKPGALFLEKVEFTGPEDTVRIHGAMILEFGDNANLIVSPLVNLMSESPDDFAPVEIAGHKFFANQLDDNIKTKLLVGSVGKYFVLGFGEDCISAAIQRMNGDSVAAWLVQLDSKNKFRKRTTLGYINLGEVRESLVPIGPPEARQIVNDLGFGNVLSFESATGFSELQMVSRMRINFDGQPSGLFNLFGDHAIDSASLSEIPSDSIFALKLSADGKSVMDFVEMMMANYSPHELEELRSEMERFKQETSIDLRNEIINRLGPTVTVFNGAGDGWFAGLLLAVDIKDADQFSATVKKMIKWMVIETENDPYSPRFLLHKIGEQEVYSTRMFGLPFEPAWAITDDKLVVGLYPSSLPTGLGRLDFESIDSMPEVASLFDSLQNDDKLLAISYSDMQRQFEYIYLYAQIMLGAGQSFSMDRRYGGDEFTAAMYSSFGDLRLPPARVIHQHLRPSTTIVKRNAAGFVVETKQTMPIVDVTFIAPVAVAVLLPAVQQARSAARRTQSANNIRHQIIAMHNYHDTHKRLPPAYSTNDDGEALLSWRVQLLPYMEHNNLYDQFHHDEPWDSEHNLALTEQMPDVFRSPQSAAEPDMTVYRGIGGEDGIMGTPDQRRTLGTIVDGTSNTIAVIECTDELAVPWTKPDDGLSSEMFDKELILGMYPNGTNAGFADGSAHFVPKSVDKQTLINLMKMDDGNYVDLLSLVNGRESKDSPRTTVDRALIDPQVIEVDPDADSTPGDPRKSADDKIESITPETMKDGDVIILTSENFLGEEMTQMKRERDAETNVRGVIIALHNYHSSYRAFPNAYNTDDDGNPLFSWRVHILPFIEQNRLHDQIRLDEPWDSVHNSRLLSQMPPVFGNGSELDDQGKTTLLAFGGENGSLPKPAADADRSSSMTGFGLASFTDGTSNTVTLVVVPNELAVEWARPTEFLPDEETLKKILANPQGTRVALADGSVHKLPAQFPLDIFKQLLNRSDGGPNLDWDDLVHSRPGATPQEKRTVKDAIEVPSVPDDDRD